MTIFSSLKLSKCKVTTHLGLCLPLKTRKLIKAFFSSLCIYACLGQRIYDVHIKQIPKCEFLCEKNKIDYTNNTRKPTMRLIRNWYAKWQMRG